MFYFWVPFWATEATALYFFSDISVYRTTQRNRSQDYLDE